MNVNVMVLSSGEPSDQNQVVRVHNAKSERHALACAMEHACGGGELNMALVCSYCAVTDEEPTTEVDGADRPEPPAADGESWNVPKG